MGNQLYVGNLSEEVTEPILDKLFAEYGTVEEVRIIIDESTGGSKGYGFVRMGSDAEAAEAIEALNGTECGGREITVAEARPRRRPGAKSKRRRKRKDRRERGKGGGRGRSGKRGNGGR